MYAARSVAKKVANGALTVSVEFTNGTDTFVEDFWANNPGADPAWLQNRVANRLNELNKLSAHAESLELGAISGEFSFPPPTQDQTWAQDVFRLKQIKEAVEMGLLPENDPDFVEVKKRVKRDFKKDFIDSVKII